MKKAKRSVKSKRVDFKPFSKMTYVSAIFITFVIVVTGIIYYLYRETNSFSRPNYDAVASVYHSEMIGVDAGYEYIYSIFENKKANDGSFFYIKSKASISIIGSGESKDIDSGLLKTKDDFKKINEDIDQDTRSDSERLIVYSYVNNGKNLECNTIDELASKLFSK